MLAPIMATPVKLRPAVYKDSLSLTFLPTLDACFLFSVVAAVVNIFDDSHSDWGETESARDFNCCFLVAEINAFFMK